MFEQSLYNQEAFAPTPEIHEGDLFYNYEFKNWNFSPRLYKILGAAVLLDLLFLAVIGQADLTKKGCDTFITSTVCQVIDTAYVANVLFGTKREYADAVYEKTELKDADITFVDVSNEEPALQYPEGYFALANPEQAALLQQQASNTNSGYIAPGIPVPTTSNENNLLAQKAKLPKANPNAVVGNIPDSPLGNSDNDNTDVASNPKKSGGHKLSGANSTNSSNQSPEPESQPTPITSDAVSPVTINRDVLKGWGKEIAERVDKKELDLSKNFNVVAQATLTADGKLDNTIDKKTKKPKSTFVKSEGDPQMVDVVKSAIEAIGDSGWLGYLKSQGLEKVTFTFAQDDQQLYVIITSDQPSADRANTISSGLNGLIQGALLGDGMNLVKLGDDEKTLLKNAKAVPSGKQITLNFSLPKPVAQEMINRNIQKAKEAETGIKPNSQLQEPLANRNTARY